LIGNFKNIDMPISGMGKRLGKIETRPQAILNEQIRIAAHEIGRRRVGAVDNEPHLLAGALVSRDVGNRTLGAIAGRSAQNIHD
jgi:hypothetical protein